MANIGARWGLRSLPSFDAIEKSDFGRQPALRRRLADQITACRSGHTDGRRRGVESGPDPGPPLFQVLGSIGTICRENLDKRALRQLCCFTFANSISQHALHAL